jgi:hypothetical protein
MLVGALLIAACASQPVPPRGLLKADLEAMREAVAATVPDASRAADVNEAINGLEAQLLSFENLTRNFRADVIALNARPDVTRAELDSLFRTFDEKRVAIRKRLIELHLQMTAATTAGEWKALFPYERALLKFPRGA